jgi:hypothetical protein
MRSALLFLVIVGCGGPSAAPVDAGVPDAGTFAKMGVIDIAAYSYPVGSHTFSGGSVGASFVDAVTVTGPSCTPIRDGVCTLSLCGPTLDAGAPAPRAAGAVTLDGVAGGPITLTPSDAGYAPITSAVLLFSAGDAITASAPGDPAGAPAFQRAVKAPSYVFVSEPPFPGTGPISLERTKDLQIVWSSGTTGTTTATFNGPDFLLECSVDATAGKLTVPASVLEKLPQIVAPGPASFSVMTRTTDLRGVGDWGVLLRVTADGARPGGIASAPLLLP